MPSNFDNICSVPSSFTWEAVEHPGISRAGVCLFRSVGACVGSSLPVKYPLSYSFVGLKPLGLHLRVS